MAHKKLSIQEIAAAIKQWLVTGDISPELLADEFQFSSPYWKEASRDQFIQQFCLGDDYKNKVLSKITKFDSMITLFDETHTYFSITLRYTTNNGTSVNEAVLGKTDGSFLTQLTSIYDLTETRKAFEL